MGETLFMKKLSEMVRVTPTKAEEILAASNHGNRTISAAKIKKYSDDMRAGIWRGDNGESIKFDTDGNLIDGQHRLTALIATGTTLTMEFRYNVDPAAKSTIDTGKSRSGGDVLVMQAGVQKQTAAAISRALNLLYQYENGLSLNLGGKTGLTNTAMLNAYHDSEAKVQEALEFIHHHLPKRGLLSPGDTLFIVMVLLPLNGDGFLRKVLSGEDVSKASNEHLLREYLIARKTQQTGAKTPPHVILYTIIRAWNYTVDGKVYASMGGMRYMNGAALPVAKPCEESPDDVLNFTLVRQAWQN